MSSEKSTMVQLNVSFELLKKEPAIWRRLLVPCGIDLYQLHLVIQASFGWPHSDHYVFIIGDSHHGNPTYIGEPEYEGTRRLFDGTAVKVRDFTFPGYETNCLYIHETGILDYWIHRVVLEDTIAIDPAPPHASCIAGAGARPPKTVTCPVFFDDFLEEIADPCHPEHANALAECGGSFDPEAFDLADTDRNVQAAIPR